MNPLLPSQAQADQQAEKMRKMVEEKRQLRGKEREREEREKKEQEEEGGREESAVPRKQWGEPGHGQMPVLAQQYDATGFISEGLAL